MKIVLVSHHQFDSWNIPYWFSERLRREFPQVEVVHLRGYAGLEAELGDAEAAMTWSLQPEQFRLARGSLNRSEEHTSELQSRGHLVCRLLLEKKKKR